MNWAQPKKLTVSEEWLYWTDAGRAIFPDGADQPHPS
jgi:hypothetical protein